MSRSRWSLKLGAVTIVAVTLVAVVVAVGWFAIVARPSSAHGTAASKQRPTAARSTEAVPPNLVQAALNALSAYGQTKTVDLSVASTFQAWRAAEPNNTSAYPPSALPDTKPVYGLIVTGDFTVVPPATTLGGSPANYDMARIVFDDQILVDQVPLNVRLWQGGAPTAPWAPGQPLFGQSFDDQ